MCPQLHTYAIYHSNISHNEGGVHGSWNTINHCPKKSVSHLPYGFVINLHQNVLLSGYPLCTTSVSTHPSCSLSGHTHTHTRSLTHGCMTSLPHQDPLFTLKLKRHMDYARSLLFKVFLILQQVPKKLFKGVMKVLSLFTSNRIVSRCRHPDSPDELLPHHLFSHHLQCVYACVFLNFYPLVPC